jgi:hypothetical protein
MFIYAIELVAYLLIMWLIVVMIGYPIRGLMRRIKMLINRAGR